MFRKLILSAVIATGTLTGMAMTATNADAHPPVDFHRRYEVMVECGRHWESRGSYYDRYEADRRAEHLRCDGFRVEIREF